MSDSPFSVSLIIAVWPNAAQLLQCLASIEAQLDEQMQIIVVSLVDPPLDLVQRFKSVEWIKAEAGALIPNLWARGMAAARGEVVAITTGHFEPAADWVAQIQGAHQRLSSAGIGGVIDPPQGGGAVDWAIYFLRYSNYFKYDREQIVADIAGDNAAYKRRALEQHWDLIRDGFWELEFHRRLLAMGESLAFVPAIRLTQRTSFGVRCFCAQRVRHGRHFGRDRMRGKPVLVRIAAVMAAPLIPVVLMAKILRRLLRRPTYFAPFLRSLPVLALFVVSWALGEMWGYATSGSSGISSQNRVSG
jgi:hypothetical protein